MRILLLALSFAFSSAIDGTWYCTQGFIMDTFCIDLGTLLDKPDLRSLANPDQHSIHCVVDVPSCVASGYQVLVEPDGYTQGDDYIQDVKLDSAGNDLVVTAARNVGVCGTCTGTGTQVQGFSATVIGYLDSGTVPGSDPNSTANGDPPILRVVELLPSTTPCPAAPVPDSTPSPNSPILAPSSFPAPSAAVKPPTSGSPDLGTPAVTPSPNSPILASSSSPTPVAVATKLPTSKSPNLGPPGVLFSVFLSFIVLFSLRA